MMRDALIGPKQRFGSTSRGAGGEAVKTVEGISPFHDWLLMHLDMWIHNWLVQPFFAEEGFPFKLIEQYSTELKGETKYVQTTSRR